MRGMSRSSRTTSGPRRSASATASCPSAARPTTSTSGSACSSAAVPSRMRRWSSAMRTRVGTGVEPNPAVQLLAGFEAIARVARGLVAGHELPDMAEAALEAMREALELDAAALYLPEEDAPPPLARAVACGSSPLPTERLDLEPEAWRLAVAHGRPLVLQGEAPWLGPHPFDPPASAWLVLPLVSGRTTVGAVLAARHRPLELDAAAATVLALLADLLTAGVATALLRQRVQRAEVERERLRLAADIHDGLAQDLALAKRELALLDSKPGEEVAGPSRDRLRAAVGSAHRLGRARLEALAVHVPLGGLAAAVADACRRPRTLDVALTTVGGAIDVAPETGAAVLRVLNEALSNAERHAAARHVAVRLTFAGDRVELEVADDGVGLRADAAPAGPGEGHFGLTIMRERARSAGGRVELRAGPDGGTVVALEVPTP